ncbi:MAG: cupredoxin domain-containing protein [Actinomycetota bacterium]
MRLTRFAITLAVVALLGAACGGGGDGGNGGETTDSVTMVDNEFQPSTFTASAETITVTNDGQALHSFTLEAAGIDQDVQAGESADIELSGLDAGSHDFTCKYHPEMTGSVTVE